MVRAWAEAGAQVEVDDHEIRRAHVGLEPRTAGDGVEATAEIWNPDGPLDQAFVGEGVEVFLRTVCAWGDATAGRPTARVGVHRSTPA